MLQRLNKHTEKILELADFIEGLAPERFSMGVWGTYGEPRCICGWFMHNNCRMEKDGWEEAGEMLGMPDYASSAMFSGNGKYVSPKQAASALRHYAVTGEFNGW